jgi:hypothetical protein
MSRHKPPPPNSVESAQDFALRLTSNFIACDWVSLSDKWQVVHILRVSLEARDKLMSESSSKIGGTD